MENISLELIEELAKKINENSLNEITLEKGDEKITLKKEVRREVVSTATYVPQSVSNVAPKATATSKKED